MLPVFENFIKFLKQNKELEFLKEGYYWCDHCIIRAFSKDGDLINVAKLRVKEDLSMTVEVYDNPEFELESWGETVNRHSNLLIELEEEAKYLIEKNIERFRDRRFVILNSGGKDSAAVQYLVKQCVDDIEIIFNNTKIESPETYKFIKSNKDIKILTAKESFYKVIKEENFIPSRNSRSCCDRFKKNLLIDNLNENDKYLFFMGMRNEESNTRSKYDFIWKNKIWKKREWDALLPIKKWTAFEVWLFIFKNKIDINEKYFKGYSRVGCSVVCPFTGKLDAVLDRYWYPKIRSNWENILIDDFRRNNKDLIMNCTEKQYLVYWSGGRVKTEPSKEVIRQFALRNNIDEELAKKYFNHKCCDCGQYVKNKDDIAMNMKFMGTNTSIMYCKEHLMSRANLTEKGYLDCISKFKELDCELF